MNLSKLCIGGSAALLCAAATASAGSVNMTLDQTEGKNIKIHYEDQDRTVNAALFTWDVKSGPGFLGSTIQSFCIELTQNIAVNGTYDYTVTPTEDAPMPGSPDTGAPDGMGPAKANLLERLWGSFFDVAVSGNNHAKAAFQLAVWEVVYDGDTDVYSGDFRVQSTSDSNTVNAASTADTWLTIITDVNYTGPVANLGALSSMTRQDQLVVVPTPGAAVGGLAALGMVAVRRRR
jgi:hypothetical protein